MVHIIKSDFYKYKPIVVALSLSLSLYKYQRYQRYTPHIPTVTAFTQKYNIIKGTTTTDDNMDNSTKNNTTTHQHRFMIVIGSLLLVLLLIGSQSATTNSKQPLLSRDILGNSPNELEYSDAVSIFGVKNNAKVGCTCNRCDLLCCKRCCFGVSCYTEKQGDLSYTCTFSSQSYATTVLSSTHYLYENRHFDIWLLTIEWSFFLSETDGDL